MVPLASLGLPILASAALVFVASAIVHMVLPFHKGDLKKLPSEDGILAALRGFTMPPGDYVFPCASSMKDMKDPAFVEKWKQGPVGVLTVLPSRPPAMGKALVLWFVYCCVVSLFAAYVAGRAQAPGAHYLAVFRFAGVTAFVGYTLALWQQTIWYGRAWTTAAKSTVDGLVYGLLTGGVFGWLWPR